MSSVVFSTAPSTIAGCTLSFIWLSSGEDYTSTDMATTPHCHPDRSEAETERSGGTLRFLPLLPLCHPNRSEAQAEGSGGTLRFLPRLPLCHPDRSEAPAERSGGTLRFSDGR